MTYEVRVPGMLVSDTTINGSTYRQLRFPGEGVLCDESLPELPAVSRITGHAPDAQVTMQAQFSDSVVLPDYLVFPAQPAWTWTCPPAPPPPFAIDSAFYQTNASYPQAREYLDTLGIWRDLGIHVTAVVPFRYNPASGELVAYTRIILTVTFQGGSLPPAVARSRPHTAKSGQRGQNANRRTAGCSTTVIRCRQEWPRNGRRRRRPRPRCASHPILPVTGSGWMERTRPCCSPLTAGGLPP